MPRHGPDRIGCRPRTSDGVALMLSVLVDRPGSFVTRAFSAVRLIVCGTGNDRSGTFRRQAETLHLFQELAEMDGCQPALSWTYRDEDFGGTVAGLGRRRGGPRTIAATGSQVLQRFVGGIKFQS